MQKGRCNSSMNMEFGTTEIRTLDDGRIVAVAPLLLGRAILTVSSPRNWPYSWDDGY